MPAFTTSFTGRNDDSVTFYVPGQAVPQGSKTAFISKSTGRPIVVDKDMRLPRWRATVTHAAMERMANPPDGMTFPLAEPIAIFITFVVARPRGHFGTGKNSHLIKPSAPKHPGSMPDLDKLLRAIFDALTDAQLWNDDGQVVWVQAAKKYPDETPLHGPGVHVTVGELP